MSISWNLAMAASFLLGTVWWVLFALAVRVGALGVPSTKGQLLFVLVCSAGVAAAALFLWAARACRPSRRERVEPAVVPIQVERERRRRRPAA